MTAWTNRDAAFDLSVRDILRLLDHPLLSPPQPQQAPVSPPIVQRDRRVLLRKVRSHWIESVLDHSLRKGALLTLRLEEQPDAIANPWHLIFQQPEKTPHPLPIGTHITQVYDTAEGELLILGAPGAGKTTLLLELARDLLARAEDDEQYPIPVVFNLSPWALKQQPLVDWLVEELNTRYQVPSKLGQTWIEADQILPLLDGLDEVAPTARSACIEAINIYRGEHGLLPLVVCSRQADYLAQAGRLLVRSAVLVQPLTHEQIDASLAQGGEPLWALRVALHQDATLRELTNTPLMLSILTLAYHGKPVEELLRDASIEERQRQIFERYVGRMLTRRGPLHTGTSQRVVQWLTYLAQQMREHQQTIFYAEYLQSDWLMGTQQQTVTWLATRLPAIVLGGCIGVLVFLFIGGGGYTDLVFLLQMGLLGGFVGSCLSLQVTTEPISVRKKGFTSTQAHVRSALLLGLLVAASRGLYLHQANPSSYDSGYFLSDWLRDGCILGLGMLLSGRAFQVLFGRTPKQWVSVSHKHRSLRGHLAIWMNTIAPLHIWQAALMFGAGIGLSIGSIYWLSVGLSNGLTVSAIVVLVHVILARMVWGFRFAERIYWTWHGLLRPTHLRTSLIVAGALFLFFVLSLGYDLIGGLIQGLKFGLIYWILLGLYQGMKQEHLEDQNRQQFNQGIRRSLRNGLLIGLISALLISAIWMLSDELSYELSYGPLVLIAGIVVMWMLSGGPTILRHYLNRWLLARSHRFPWRAQAFLDDVTARILLQRVGGGYRFIHRRLLDYFADLDTTTPASATASTPASVPEA